MNLPGVNRRISNKECRRRRFLLRISIFRVRHSIFNPRLVQLQKPKHYFAFAFKWIRIIYRCWQTRESYDEARYLNRLREICSPLAHRLNE